MTFDSLKIRNGSLLTKSGNDLVNVCGKGGANWRWWIIDGKRIVIPSSINYWPTGETTSGGSRYSWFGGSPDPITKVYTMELTKSTLKNGIWVIDFSIVISRAGGGSGVWSIDGVLAGVPPSSVLTYFVGYQDVPYYTFRYRLRLEYKLVGYDDEHKVIDNYPKVNDDEPNIWLEWAVKEDEEGKYRYFDYHQEIFDENAPITIYSGWDTMLTHIYPKGSVPPEIILYYRWASGIKVYSHPSESASGKWADMVGVGSFMDNGWRQICFSENGGIEFYSYWTIVEMDRFSNVQSERV